MREPAPRVSLRRHLLLGLLAPVLGIVALGAALLYAFALEAADSAYDRTLLASAKAIGEQLHVQGEGPQAHLAATLPYSALEAFEADNRSRLYYRVSGFRGEMVSGFTDLPPPRPAGEAPNTFAALVHFYDERFRGEAVRMAVLLQPVAGPEGHGMATIQVAETLELRESLARSLLLRTLSQQAVLIAVIAFVVVFVVQRATRPVRELGEHVRARADTDLSPLPEAMAAAAPRELLPLVEATNGVMARLAHLLEHQKRFVRDASHQLRTPLAVLKAQVQSARRGDVDAGTALAEIDHTVTRATELANQMLALAKVEQLRQQGDAPVLDWAGVVRAVALDLSALVAAAQLDFELEMADVAVPVRGHEWALRELTRNLLHNAIKQSPRGARLSVRLQVEGQEARLVVADSGPGISAELRQRLFEPFVAGGPQAGSGLGLAICREIVATLGGSVALVNREHDGRLEGLDATVRLPTARLGGVAA
ncbi:MAG: sensor histidine kinase N-terminal domain-containing protein [Burkholderiales bacterium]|nr:sensor histidine kinase N-terminal domain-containing protein [Burkholderiales bacterium]